MKTVYDYQIFYIMVCFFVICTACNNDLPSDLSVGEPVIAMEVIAHVTLIDQTEYLQEGLHDDFLSPEVKAILNRDPFLKRKLNRDLFTDADTVFTYDEIPLIKETRTYTRIFADGSCETRTEFLTPFADNIVYRLTTVPVPEKTRIALTIVKDGLLSAYNADGDLLFQEDFPGSDMRDFLDTMKVYVLKMSFDSKKTPCNLKYGIRAFKQHANTRFRISELQNRNVKIESDVNDVDVLFAGHPQLKGILKSCIELDPEMTKVLQYEVYRGNNLIHRRKYTYSSNRNLMNLSNNEVICENPESIETFTLTLNRRGNLVVRHSKEFYKQNQTWYYFK